MVIFFKEEANRKHLGCWTSSPFRHDTSRNIAWFFFFCLIFSFRQKNGSCASFHKNWGRRRREGRCFDGWRSISSWRNFFYRACWVRKVDPNYTISEYKHSLFLIFKNKKLGVLLSLANFVKAMVFNFLVDWLRPRWIRGSFLRQILLKEIIHYCWTGNMRIFKFITGQLLSGNLTFI